MVCVCVFLQVASDFQTNWVYAIDILDYDSFIGAEEYGNLFTVMRDRSVCIGGKTLTALCIPVLYYHDYFPWKQRL